MRTALLLVTFYLLLVTCFLLLNHGYRTRTHSCKRHITFRWYSGGSFYYYCWNYPQLWQRSQGCVEEETDLADRSTREYLSSVETVQGWRYWPAIAVLCLGLLSSFYLHSIVVEREEAANKAGFVNNANIITSSFQREVDLDVEVVESVGGLYAASDKVERSEFEHFVEDSLTRHDDILALEWLPLVKGSQRARFEEMAHVAGYEDFEFTEMDETGQLVEASPRKEYFPVFYVEPMEGNKKALGFDMASNPIRFDAMKLARDTGQMIATERLVPVQEKDDEFGVLVCMPVYREEPENSTVEDLRRNLEGFLLGVLEIDDLVEEAMETIDQNGINFVLVDENAPPENRVLAHYKITREKMEVLDFDNEGVLNSERVKWKASVNIPGRLWTLYFYQSPYYLGAYSTRSAWIVVAVGFPFSLLLAVYIFTTLRNTARIEKLALDLQKANISLEKEMAERKRVDKLLRDGKVKLERKNEELEAFMYMAAHDLRTPIVSIHGFFGLLNRTLGDQLDEKQKWVMERISANLTHFDGLLGDLVEFSRVSDDSVERGDYDVGAVVQQVLEENSEKIAALGADIRVHEDLPAVHFNETRLYQVFSNLISNSLKFARKGATPEVDIGFTDGSEGAPSDQIFYVKDNGIGIEEEQLESVFDLFFRLDPDDETGSGVGLAIVRRIIDLEDGRIWIESVPGEGTTFFFTLPLAKSENRDQRTEDSKSLDS